MSDLGSTRHTPFLPLSLPPLPSPPHYNVTPSNDISKFHKGFFPEAPKKAPTKASTKDLIKKDLTANFTTSNHVSKNLRSHEPDSGTCSLLQFHISGFWFSIHFSIRPRCQFRHETHFLFTNTHTHTHTHTHTFRSVSIKLNDGRP